MQITDLSYALRPENIACEPAEVRLGRRDLGKLMVIDREKAKRFHTCVLDLPQWLSSGDVLVLNNSKRMPGVLKGRTVEHDAQVELRFVGLESERAGLCRPYPLHFIEPGREIRLDDGNILRVLETGIPPYDLCRMDSPNGDLKQSLHSVGLPITSFFYQGYWDLDNYNNCYASEEGSLESPMVGLHFTDELLDAVKARGVSVTFVTLHPEGSWLPFIEEDIEFHQMQFEKYVVPPETAELVNEARARGNRIVACGSTAVRTLETVAKDGRIRAGSGQTNLYISPGYTFQIVDWYFTNFHPARTSLMVLDAAFCEPQLLLESYREAVEKGYLFYEFGDAVMYI
jgi:S-adenosylmethionine:tRNA ribosyltransferase-isomerase